MKHLQQNSDSLHDLSKKEREIYSRLDARQLPQHIAIIMDGNGRWASRRHLPRFVGHRSGVQTVRGVVETAARIGLPYLTLYAFSAENWKKRPAAEVDFLMQLLRQYLKQEVPRLNRNNVRLAYIGRTWELPESVQERLKWAQEATAGNAGMLLTLALNYGARTEIVDAFKSIINAARNNGGVDHLQVDEELVSRHLYRSMPDPDLVIRTSGELRVSNFLLWQIAYAEIYVTEKLWPDFEGADLLHAIADYQRRERRYGGLSASANGHSSTNVHNNGHGVDGEHAHTLAAQK
ncbi:MAG TPA: isoprenyl transferase [Terriglobales bacterium]|nr:isoprenyl transferase [Terriglobales bacterium]